MSPGVYVLKTGLDQILYSVQGEFRQAYPNYYVIGHGSDQDFAPTATTNPLDPFRLLDQPNGLTDNKDIKEKIHVSVQCRYPKNS